MVFEYFSHRTFDQHLSLVMAITRAMIHLVANSMLLTTRSCGRLRELKLCQVVFGGFLRVYKLIKTIVAYFSNSSITTQGRCAAITVHAYTGHPEILPLGNAMTQMTSTPTLQLMNTGGLQDVISQISLGSVPMKKIVESICCLMCSFPAPWIRIVDLATFVQHHGQSALCRVIGFAPSRLLMGSTD